MSRRRTNDARSRDDIDAGGDVTVSFTPLSTDQPAADDDVTIEYYRLAEKRVPFKEICFAGLLFVLGTVGRCFFFVRVCYGLILMDLYVFVIANCVCVCLLCAGLPDVVRIDCPRRDGLVAGRSNVADAGVGRADGPAGRILYGHGAVCGAACAGLDVVEVAAIQLAHWMLENNVRIPCIIILGTKKRVFYRIHLYRIFIYQEVFNVTWFPLVRIIQLRNALLGSRGLIG